MATNNPFEEIRVNALEQERSYKWYQDQIALLFKGSQSTNTNKLIAESKLVKNIVPGEMYLYLYDPKFKDELPYYDRLPLVFPFRKTKDGFYGINLHYLPYGIRFKVLEELQKYATGNENNADRRIRLSWRLLETVAKLKPAQFAVKQYLNNHVKSSFYRIPYSDWITASQLPIERFAKMQKNLVWRDFNKFNKNNTY
jgi:hypothetical protein